jgi:hypothetical protein
MNVIEQEDGARGIAGSIVASLEQGFPASLEVPGIRLRDAEGTRRVADQPVGSFVGKILAAESYFYDEFVGCTQVCRHSMEDRALAGTSSTFQAAVMPSRQSPGNSLYDQPLTQELLGRGNLRRMKGIGIHRPSKPRAAASARMRSRRSP